MGEEIKLFWIEMLSTTHLHIFLDSTTTFLICCLVSAKLERKAKLNNLLSNHLFENLDNMRTISVLSNDKSRGLDIMVEITEFDNGHRHDSGYEIHTVMLHYLSKRQVNEIEIWHLHFKSQIHNFRRDWPVRFPSPNVTLIFAYNINYNPNADSNAILRKLAANNEQFITRVLGIKDPSHRSKITIKAMDAVLFGPPKEAGSHLKDLVLVTLLTLALLGCFKAYQRNREYQTQLSNMMKDMEKLREAEENLQALEKNARNPLRRGSALDGDSPPEYVTNEVVQQLRQELEEEREKCCRLQQEMEGVESEDRHMWDPPLALQHWLQLTYERERLAFEKKHLAAREQFNQAKEMCEKLNKQRRSLMGMLSSVHGKMDNIDQSISLARTTMEEVTQELSERDNRWSNIEMLAGFNITKNAGLHTLELMLRPQVNGGRPHSVYSPSIVHQLLSNQSALMYLTMGGTQTTASATPTIYEANSVADVRLGGGHSTASSRKKSHLLTRDSGSSISSETSTTATNSRMRFSQSQNFSSDMSVYNNSVEEEVLPRSASTSSLRTHHRSSSQINKDDSSTDETDHSPSISDSTSFSIGGSRLTINSEGGQTITGSQVSPPSSPNLLLLSQLSSDQSLYDEMHTTKSVKKRSPMLKSYSQDTGTSTTHKAKQKACENMSASEPSLDNPKSSTVSSSLRSKQITASSFEEGNSSDSSLNSTMPSPNSDQIKKKKWFQNNISSRLSLGKSKKKKEKELDKDKESK
ncbi:unnamed protein product, partial [Meganyctiphanes norvegica]